MIVLLALVTVSRRGEIIQNLKLGSFGFENKCVHILKNKQRNNKKEYKTIYLSDFVINEIKTYLKNQKVISLDSNERFFPNLTESKRLIEKKYHEICLKLGLRSKDIHFVFHSLRHCGTSYVGRYTVITILRKNDRQRKQLEDWWKKEKINY